MKKLQALVLSPLDDSCRHIVDEIKNSLKASGVTPMHIYTQIKPGEVWVNAITDAIQEADIIIADVSKTSKNSFIFWELGFASALRKPAMLLLSTDAAERIPLGLEGYLMATYDPKDLTSLQGTISRFIEYQKSRWSGKDAA